MSQFLRLSSYEIINKALIRYAGHHIDKGTAIRTVEAVIQK